MSSAVVSSCASQPSTGRLSKKFEAPPLPSAFRSTMSLCPRADLTDGFLMASLGEFSHFDVQSVFFNYAAVKAIAKNIHVAVNIKTGASAAARQSITDNLKKSSQLDARRRNETASVASFCDMIRMERQLLGDRFDIAQHKRSAYEAFMNPNNRSVWWDVVRDY